MMYYAFTMFRRLISSELRQKLLTYYFTHPAKKHYVRELAALLTLDPGNLSKELKAMSEEGLFLRDEKKHATFYELNPKHPLYNELKQMVLKTGGAKNILRHLVK